jgi:tight adherence protein C
VATLVLTPLAPVAVVVLPLSLVVLTWFARRRAIARHRHAVERALPEAADLLATSLEAGLTVRQALTEASRWSPDPVGAELRRAIADIDRGRTLEAVALAAGQQLGAAAQPLLHVLVAGDRLGVPIAESLRRFVADLGLRRQLDAEARARRLPVRLSLPLVLLVLPAFGLLTVAPTLLAAFGGLGAPAAP